MSLFFKMASRDRWLLIILLGCSVIGFLPWWRDIEVAGMSLFGWLMALLMTAAPIVTLIYLLSEKNNR